MSPGGVFALGLPWQADYASPPLLRLGASIYHTLAAEFPEIATLPGERLFLLASDTPLPADPQVFSVRLAERRLDTRWVVPSTIEYVMTNDRVAATRRILEMAVDVRVNRDLEPVSCFYGLSVWLSRLRRELGQPKARPWQLAWLAVPLLGVAILHLGRPMRPRVAVPIAIGLVGLAEMVLEVVILLAFQVVHGYLYGQVGVIMTGFMAGLALVAGMLGGLAFALAAVCRQTEGEEGSGRVTGLLYGVDLAGGCVGALLASVFLVPTTGLPVTCMSVALAAATGAWLTVPRRDKWIPKG